MALFCERLKQSDSRTVDVPSYEGYSETLVLGQSLQFTDESVPFLLCRP